MASESLTKPLHEFTLERPLLLHDRRLPGVLPTFERGHPPPQRCLVDSELTVHGRDRPPGVDDELYSLVFVLRRKLPTCPCHDEHSLL